MLTSCILYKITLNTPSSDQMSEFRAEYDHTENIMNFWSFLAPKQLWKAKIVRKPAAIVSVYDHSMSWNKISVHIAWQYCFWETSPKLHLFFICLLSKNDHLPLVFGSLWKISIYCESRDVPHTSQKFLQNFDENKVLFEHIENWWSFRTQMMLFPWENQGSLQILLFIDHLRACFHYQQFHSMKQQSCSGQIVKWSFFAHNWL